MRAVTTVKGLFQHPRSRSFAVGDAEAGPELREDRGRQPLRHDVGKLLRGGDMKNSDLSERNFLPYKMNVKFYVLCPPMMHRIGRQIDCDNARVAR